MEACGSAHYWARKFAAMGHEVRLIAGSSAPVRQDEQDGCADALAIWEAAQRPGMKFVSVKSEAQQAVLMLHRMRSQLVKMRTMQIQQLRGLLYEFGLADLPQGRQAGMERIPAELERLEDAAGDGDRDCACSDQAHRGARPGHQRHREEARGLAKTSLPEG